MDNSGYKVEGKQKLIPTIVIVLIVGVLIGGIIGFTIGVEQGISWCVEKGINCLKIKGIDLGIDSQTLTNGILNYKAEINRCFNETGIR